MKGGRAQCGFDVGPSAESRVPKLLNNVIFVIKEYNCSGYTVYLLVKLILRFTLYLQMLYRQLMDQ